MQHYMVTLTFPFYKTEAFMSLIPRQRAMIVRLLGKGKVSGFSLNADRTQAWMVVKAKDFREVETLLERFPMYDHFDYDIDPLALHDNAFVGLPKVVLN